MVTLIFIRYIALLERFKGLKNSYSFIILFISVVSWKKSEKAFYICSYKKYHYCWAIQDLLRCKKSLKNIICF